MSGGDLPPWVAAQFGSPIRRPPGRERSPRRAGEDGPLFAPGWAAAQQQMPVPIAISTPGMTQAQQQVTEVAVTQLAAGVLGSEERLARLEAHAEFVVPKLASVESQVQGLNNTVQSLTSTLGTMEEAFVNMMTQVTGTQSSLDAFKNQMTASLRTAEGTLTASLNSLAQKVGQTESMIRQVESAASNSKGMGPGAMTSSGSTNFVPWKHLTPTKFGNKVELWREWQEDVRGYFDGTKPGIREVLQAREHEDEEQGR